MLRTWFVCFLWTCCVCPPRNSRNDASSLEFLCLPQFCSKSNIRHKEFNFHLHFSHVDAED